MAPFTVSTRGVVLGGKAGSGLHDSIDLGREDAKGALRVDASTNVKDTDLVFTTTDNTVRTVRPPPLFFFFSRRRFLLSIFVFFCRAPPGRAQPTRAADCRSIPRTRAAAVGSRRVGGRRGEEEGTRSLRLLLFAVIDGTLAGGKKVTRPRDPSLPPFCGAPAAAA